MHSTKKVIVITGLLIIVSISIAAIKPLQDRPKNLKILPKHISIDSLNKVMDSYGEALNVKCMFCHVTGDASDNYKEDYASDKKQKKEITRNMMLMTSFINKQYFPYRKKPEMITCYTCHRGMTVPLIDSTGN
jgi:hypothetical protein